MRGFLQRYKEYKDYKLMFDEWLWAWGSTKGDIDV